MKIAGDKDVPFPFTFLLFLRSYRAIDRDIDLQEAFKKEEKNRCRGFGTSTQVSMPRLRSAFANRHKRAR